MYFCLETQSPQYKHTFSAQRRLIKTYKTECFTMALEAESQGYRHLLNRTFCNSVGIMTRLPEYLVSMLVSTHLQTFCDHDFFHVCSLAITIQTKLCHLLSVS